MKNYDESVEINHNTNWPYLPNYPSRILIIWGSGSGKTNGLLNLVKYQWPDLNKILFIHQRSIQIKMSLINRREKEGIETLKNSKAFIEYSQTIDDVYENLEDYNPTKKRKVLIVFDDANMETNKE